jgi:hypothetical protein
MSRVRIVRHLLGCWDSRSLTVSLASADAGSGVASINYSARCVMATALTFEARLPGE